MLSSKEGRLLYKIIFYEDASGKSDIGDFLDNVAENAVKGRKEAKSLHRILLLKLQLLQKSGPRLGLPDVRFLKGSKYRLWELRIMHVTGHYRFCFTVWKGNILFLTFFIKRSRKTPDYELKKAENRLKDWISRYGK